MIFHLIVITTTSVDAKEHENALRSTETEKVLVLFSCLISPSLLKAL